MATSQIKLPPGFVLETPAQPSGLPPGFVLETPEQKPVPEQKPAIGNLAKEIWSALKGIGTGAGKEAVVQGRNILSFVNPTEHEVPELPESFKITRESPSSQIAGSSLIKALELVGAPEVTGASRIASLLPRMGAEAATAGVVTLGQTGDPEQALRTGAMVGGFVGLGGLIGKLMESGGGKIQMSTIRPRLVDYKEGFKPETVTALGLKGSLSQSYKQVESKLAELRKARSAVLDPKTAQPIDLQQIFVDAAKDMDKKLASLKNAGQAGAMKVALKGLHRDISGARNGNMTLNITEAENAKEGMGLLGVWAYGRTDLDAVAKEKVANDLYLRLKTAIEKALPAGSEVAKLNAEMSKLLPVRNAMLARIPVEERNRMFSLADIAALLPAMASGRALDASLLAATRLQKSLRFGNWLVRNAGTPSGLSGLAGKALGGFLNQGGGGSDDIMNAIRNLPRK